jgi:hypothetical protein
VTGAVGGFRQLFFVEPDISRDITDQSNTLIPWSTFSAYPNVVYAPHVYTRVFTPDASLNAGAGTPYFFPLDGGYNSAVRDAKALGLPLWVGEFGNGVPDDETILRAHYVYQDERGIGSSLWVWKADQSSGFSVYHGPFGMGTPFPSRVKFTSRVYPSFTAGTLRALTFEPNTGAFRVDATSAHVRCGDRAHATVLFLPAVSQGSVVAQGAAVETVDVPGGRIAYAYPRGGDYSLALGSSSQPATCGATRSGKRRSYSAASDSSESVATGGVEAAGLATLPDTSAAAPRPAVAGLVAVLVGLLIGFVPLGTAARKRAARGVVP